MSWRSFAVLLVLEGPSVISSLFIFATFNNLISSAKFGTISKLWISLLLPGLLHIYQCKDVPYALALSFPKSFWCRSLFEFAEGFQKTSWNRSSSSSPHMSILTLLVHFTQVYSGGPEQALCFQMDANSVLLGVSSSLCSAGTQACRPPDPKLHCLCVGEIGIVCHSYNSSMISLCPKDF